MEWDKIWAYNAKVIDEVAPRYTAVVKETSSKIVLTNGPSNIEMVTTEMHPKNGKEGF
jgi:hypothetical protein